MHADVQNSFECLEEDCKNRVSVRDDSKLCRSCRNEPIEVYGVKV